MHDMHYMYYNTYMYSIICILIYIYIYMFTEGPCALSSYALACAAPKNSPMALTMILETTNVFSVQLIL